MPDFSAAMYSNIYDADEADVADGIVSDGSRGEGQNGVSNPPPYVPDDLEANTPGMENGIPLRAYGKDQEFPGLR